MRKLSSGHALYLLCPREWSIVKQATDIDDSYNNGNKLAVKLATKDK